MKCFYSFNSLEGTVPGTQGLCHGTQAVQRAEIPRRADHQGQVGGFSNGVNLGSWEVLSQKIIHSDAASFQQWRAKLKGESDQIKSVSSKVWCLHLQMNVCLLKEIPHYWTSDRREMYVCKLFWHQRKQGARHQEIVGASLVFGLVSTSEQTPPFIHHNFHSCFSFSTSTPVGFLKQKVYNSFPHP